MSAMSQNSGVRKLWSLKLKHNYNICTLKQEAFSVN